MSKTNDYWRKREEDALRHYISEERKYDKELKKIYADMLAECRAEIDRFYGKYAAAEKLPSPKQNGALPSWISKHTNVRRSVM